MPERAALIVIDMLNRYEHEDAGALVASARRVVPTIKRLVERAGERDVPIVYVNDNFGNWNGGGHELSELALNGANRELVEPVLPPRNAAFVPKARHTIFYETPLDYLLRSERIDRLVLAGQVTEQCVLYSALDAYVRHYSVTVAKDAVAHIHEDLAQAALRMMELNMRATVCEAAGVFE
ncbi:MAG: cysteine hydrolase family protein [Solirubrobacteraceae bacterium]